MSSALRSSALPASLLCAVLAACSGSSSGDDVATVTLAVTDAASDELSTFMIGVESVQLLSATNPPIELLLQPVALDFVLLTDLSRVLNVQIVPEDVYTGLEVTLVYDQDRVHVHGENVPATLMDAEGNALTGTQVLPIDFVVPLQVAGGNYVVELDLDLNQSVDVDVAQNEVFFEPTLVPRVNRLDPREHAVTGDLRTVQLENSRFRVALEGPPGAQPALEVSVGPGTVFQIDGQCLLGAAGLALLDTLPLNSWVQAFGAMSAGSSRFQALTVEAGTGTYNGGTDIVEGVIVARTGGSGADATLTVRGHSNLYGPTRILEFNLTFTVLTSLANTKVVRRSSAALYDTDDLNVGQRVRAFGMLDTGTNTLDASTATDVVRMQPTWVFGEAAGAPAGGVLTMDLVRVDLRDQADFTWSDSGTNPPTPTAFTIEEHNLGIGQGIGATTPVIALGFFAPVDAPGSDFDAALVANRELLPSLLLVRDRLNGFTTTTTATAAAIDFTFSPDPAAPLERAVIDMGFAGQTDVVPTGVTLVPRPGTAGVGFYLLYDRTLQTVGLYFTFATFAQALDAALDGGATLFNVGALGVYDAGTGEVPTSLTGVTVQ
ncbi:MAG TPA: hypothetical protein VF530_17350 [Planctomycetota bacterium]